MRSMRWLPLFCVLAIGMAACSPSTSDTSTSVDSEAATTSTTGSTGSTEGSDTGETSTLRMFWQGGVVPLWHPASYETFSQAVQFEMMFSTLVDRCWNSDRSFEPCGDLAESFEVSDDARIYTFHLRENVLWHDGEPFDASDVAFTINRSFLNSPIRFSNAAWDAIEGSADVTGGQADSLAGLEVVDDYTVRVTLTEPNSAWLSDVADPNAVIVPEHILSDTDPEAVETLPFTTTSPIGTGPYRFVEYVPDQHSEFEAFQDYFLGAPNIDRVFLRYLADGDVAVAQLESGELDLAVRLSSDALERVEGNPAFDILVTPGVANTSLQFNVLNISDERVRKAAYYAIDREGIVSTVYSGLAVVNNGVHPGFAEYDGLEPYLYDPDTAQQLLADVGGGEIPLRILYDSTRPRVEVFAPIIEQQLEAVGFDVQLMPMETAAYIDAFNDIDSWDAILQLGGDQGLGPLRTQSYYDCTKNEPAYWSAIDQDCDLDQLFVDARATADPEQRNAIFEQAAIIMNERADWISLWTPSEVTIKVTGLSGVEVPPNTREFVVGIHDWTLDQ